MKPLAGSPIIILIPVFNDWEALEPLIRALDEKLAETNLNVDILLVDDGSTNAYDRCGWVKRRYLAVGTIEILELSRNLGHQRAIAVGLAYVQRIRRWEAVVIMAAVGEGCPDDLPCLVVRY